ncbi:MAG: glycosyltransferase family 9 protein [Bacteroidota bacterium]
MIKPGSRILIIHLSAIGDVIHTLPAAHALRASFPNSFLAWVVEDAGYHLIQGHPELNAVILFPKKELEKTYREKGLLAALRLVLDFRRKIRSYHFDVVIDFHNMLKSGLIALFTGAKTRVGFGPGREGNRLFLTHVLEPPTNPLHFADIELELTSRLGANIDDVRFVFPDYQKEAKAVDEFLTANSITSPFFCVAPSTSPSWSNKLWTFEGMARLIDRLSEYGQVLIVGSEIDREIINETKKLLSSKPIDTTGKFNLRELAVLLSRASLFFGGDTGPMHLAAAVGTPTIAWMGPTKPVRNGPYPGRGVSVSLDLSCQYCHKRTCPNGNNLCLQNLPFESVWAATEPYLQKLERGPKQ